MFTVAVYAQKANRQNILFAQAHRPTGEQPQRPIALVHTYIHVIRPGA